MRGLRMLLESLGIHIDPNEIEQEYQRARTAIPEAAAAIKDMADRIKAMDVRLQHVEVMLNGKTEIGKLAQWLREQSDRLPTGVKIDG